MELVAKLLRSTNEMFHLKTSLVKERKTTQNSLCFSLSYLNWGVGGLIVFTSVICRLLCQSDVSWYALCMYLSSFLSFSHQTCIKCWGWLYDCCHLVFLESEVTIFGQEGGGYPLPPVPLLPGKQLGSVAKMACSTWKAHHDFFKTQGSGLELGLGCKDLRLSKHEVVPTCAWWYFTQFIIPCISAYKKLLVLSKC